MLVSSVFNRKGHEREKRIQRTNAEMSIKAPRLLSMPKHERTYNCQAVLLALAANGHTAADKAYQARVDLPQLGQVGSLRRRRFGCNCRALCGQPTQRNRKTGILGFPAADGDFGRAMRGDVCCITGNCKAQFAGEKVRDICWSLQNKPVSRHDS